MLFSNLNNDLSFSWDVIASLLLTHFALNTIFHICAIITLFSSYWVTTKDTEVQQFVILYSILKQAGYFLDPTFFFSFKAMSAEILDKTMKEGRIFIFSLQFIFCHCLWNELQITFYPHAFRSGPV